MVVYEPAPPVMAVSSFNFHRPGSIYVNPIAEDTRMVRPRVGVPVTEWVSLVLKKKLGGAEPTKPDDTMPSRTSAVTRKSKRSPEHTSND